MESLLNELIKLIEDTRKNNKNQPYLSDIENGWNEGSNEVIDNVESIIKKYKQ